VNKVIHDRVSLLISSFDDLENMLESDQGKRSHRVIRSEIFADIMDSNNADPRVFISIT